MTPQSRTPHRLLSFCSLVKEVVFPVLKKLLILSQPVSDVKAQSLPKPFAVCIDWHKPLLGCMTKHVDMTLMLYYSAVGLFLIKLQIS